MFREGALNWSKIKGSKIPHPDSLYGLLHRSWLVQDEEDAEGEVAEDAVEEEII